MGSNVHGNKWGAWNGLEDFGVMTGCVWLCPLCVGRDESQCGCQLPMYEKA